MKLDGRRLVVAFNPHSSRASRVHENVFYRLDAAGFKYQKIEVLQASLEDNVRHIVPQLRSGDVIISTAGDGSAHAIANAVIASKLNVSVGFLAYGNFNDLAHTFNTRFTRTDPIALLESAHEQDMAPLDIYVNKKIVRHALLYSTFGWTAMAADEFNKSGARQSLQTGGAGIMRSVIRLGAFYKKSRRQARLPAMTLNGQVEDKLTDVLCVNGSHLARVFRTAQKYYNQNVFLVKTLDVTGLIKNVGFLTSSTLGRMSGDKHQSIEMVFDKPSTLPMQCDGEVAELHDVNKILVSKSTDFIRVLTTKL